MPLVCEVSAVGKISDCQTRRSRVQSRAWSRVRLYGRFPFRQIPSLDQVLGNLDMRSSKSKLKSERSLANARSVLEVESTSTSSWPEWAAANSDFFFSMLEHAIVPVRATEIRWSGKPAFIFQNWPRVRQWSLAFIVPRPNSPKVETSL